MSELIAHSEKRPWGEYREFIKNKPCTVKIITVQPEQSISLQTHNLREEFWHVISGKGIVTIGDKEYSAVSGAEYTVPQTTRHRMKAGAGEPFVVLEVSQGEFREDDIIRIEDMYGRTSNS